MIGALAAIAGNIYMQERAREKASDEATFSRNWQRGMSNTAHQRQVRDLRLAGLNPILSGNLGGASTPGGAMANLPQPRNPFSESIEQAHGLASAKVTQQQGRMVKVDADRKQAGYDLIEASSPEVNALLGTLPAGSPASQVAAGIALGVGTGKKYKEEIGSSAKSWKGAVQKRRDKKRAIEKQRRHGADMRRVKRRDAANEKQYKWSDLLSEPTFERSSGGGYGDRQY